MLSNVFFEGNFQYESKQEPFEKANEQTRKDAA